MGRRTALAGAEEPLLIDVCEVDCVFDAEGISRLAVVFARTWVETKSFRNRLVFDAVEDPTVGVEQLAIQAY